MHLHPPIPSRRLAYYTILYYTIGTVTLTITLTLTITFHATTTRHGGPPPSTRGPASGRTAEEPSSTAAALPMSAHVGHPSRNALAVPLSRGPAAVDAHAAPVCCLGASGAQEAAGGAAEPGAGYPLLVGALAEAQGHAEEALLEGRHSQGDRGWVLALPCQDPCMHLADSRQPACTSTSTAGPSARRPRRFSMSPCPSTSSPWPLPSSGTSS
jgi:hypothetical protein